MTNYINDSIADSLFLAGDRYEAEREMLREINEEEFAREYADWQSTLPSDFEASVLGGGAGR